MLPLARPGLAAILGATALALAACGTSTSTAGGPAPAGPGSAAPASSTSATSTTPGSPAASSSADTAPATGLALDNRTFTIHVPTGWKHDKLAEFGPTALAATSADGLASIGSTAACLGGSTHASLATQAAAQLKTHPQLKRVADVTVGGQRWFHLSGGRGGAFDDIYGATVRGCTSDISFDFQDQRPAAQRQQVVGSVLATYSLD